MYQFKTQNPDNDTVMDNDAASAYVENFAMEVFNRAETTMNANKVTKYVTPPLPLPSCLVYFMY